MVVTRQESIEERLQRYVDGMPIFTDRDGRHYAAVGVIFGCDDGSTEILFDRDFQFGANQRPGFFHQWVSDTYIRMRAKLCSRGEEGLNA